MCRPHAHRVVIGQNAFVSARRTLAPGGSRTGFGAAPEQPPVARRAYRGPRTARGTSEATGPRVTCGRHSGKPMAAAATPPAPRQNHPVFSAADASEPSPMTRTQWLAVLPFALTPNVLQTSQALSFAGTTLYALWLVGQTGRNDEGRIAEMLLWLPSNLWYNLLFAPVYSRFRTETIKHGRSGADASH